MHIILQNYWEKENKSGISFYLCGQGGWDLIRSSPWFMTAFQLNQWTEKFSPQNDSIRWPLVLERTVYHSAITSEISHNIHTSLKVCFHLESNWKNHTHLTENKDTGKWNWTAKMGEIPADKAFNSLQMLYLINYFLKATMHLSNVWPFQSMSLIQNTVIGTRRLLIKEGSSQLQFRPFPAFWTMEFCAIKA